VALGEGATAGRGPQNQRRAGRSACRQRTAPPFQPWVRQRRWIEFATVQTTEDTRPAEATSVDRANISLRLGDGHDSFIAATSDHGHFNSA
jgi:hypothetical protein